MVSRIPNRLLRKKKMRHLITLPAVWGIFIAGINMSNCTRSPVFERAVFTGKDTRLASARVYAGSVIKGWIYGTFMPISIIGVGLSIFQDDQNWNRHFIPFSKYGSQLY